MLKSNSVFNNTCMSLLPFFYCVFVIFVVNATSSTTDNNKYFYGAISVHVKYTAQMHTAQMHK